MRNFIFGLLIGLVLGGGIAWAATVYISLQDASGTEFGTESNPIYIEGV